MNKKVLKLALVGGALLGAGAAFAGSAPVGVGGVDMALSYVKYVAYVFAVMAAIITAIGAATGRLDQGKIFTGAGIAAVIGIAGKATELVDTLGMTAAVL